MFRERPSSWYDPPDEPSDAAYEACRKAWEEYVDDYCEDLCWLSPSDDSDKPRLNVLQPCGSCYDDPPMDYGSEWQERWFDERARERYDA